MLTLVKLLRKVTGVIESRFFLGKISFYVDVRFENCKHRFHLSFFERVKNVESRYYIGKKLFNARSFSLHVQVYVIIYFLVEYLDYFSFWKLYTFLFDRKLQWTFLLVERNHVFYYTIKIVRSNSLKSQRTRRIQYNFYKIFTKCIFTNSIGMPQCFRAQYLRLSIKRYCAIKAPCVTFHIHIYRRVDFWQCYRSIVKLNSLNI